MSFVHLHVHTEYSLLDSTNRIKDCVSRVKALGMDSVAITDHGCMSGVIDFYKAAKAAEVKPVFGCEVYVAPGSRFDKEEAGSSGSRNYHLVLLAENNEGYRNLMKIVSRGYTEGYYNKPRVDMELLREYHEGIIALSACLAGEVQQYIVRGMYGEGKAAALRYEELFGRGNFFLELQDHGIPKQQMVNQSLLQMSRETGIELAATNNVHYTYADYEQPHDILLCIRAGKKLKDKDRRRYKGGQFYLKSEEEMRRLFPYALQAIDNTQKIADRCNVEIEFRETLLPEYDVPEGYSSWEYLKKLCFEGLEKRYRGPSQELKDRLDYELSVVKSMGCADYFLIVWDFIKYAKDNKIMAGPGRGSAAGSIISYCLGITAIDPVRYRLLSEHFLNPERVSVPDIDVDFCFGRRQEIIDYAGRKYGADRVAQIITFGTPDVRDVLRDVGRVLDLPGVFVDNIAKMIPKEVPAEKRKKYKDAPMLQFTFEVNQEFKKLYHENPQANELILMSMCLEGLPRYTSRHAAGIVIGQKALDEYVPLSVSSDGSVITQFTMTALEKLGLLKMDFLGSRTLTVIRDAAALAGRRAGEEINIEANGYDDAAVYDFIGSGKTDDVFQLESRRIKNLMKELKPGSLEDVMEGLFLYRSGTMDYAKYELQKPHLSAYAVMTYQTAWLKYYYPAEFMAALMTSCIDNPSKLSGHIYTCRQMGIKILPPDINRSADTFSVDGGSIRYGLAAIKSIGRPMAGMLVEEREEHGAFTDLKDFIERMPERDTNKWLIGNFIKSGAFDSFQGTRKQLITLWAGYMEEDSDIRLPDVGEYVKGRKLAFEREVLGVYLSGHPMEDCKERWISRTTLDFQIDGETGRTRVRDGAKEIVGGVVTRRTVKYTNTNKAMCFLMLEDLSGTVEIVVFPEEYKKYRRYLDEENIIFVRGSVSVGNEEPGRLICESVISFEKERRELWLQFADKKSFLAAEDTLYGLLSGSEGHTRVVIFCKKERAVKRLGIKWNVRIWPGLSNRLKNYFGESCVKVIEKSSEN